MHTCIWAKIDDNVHHQHWGVTDEDCFPIWEYGRDLCLLWQGGWIFIILEFVAIEVLDLQNYFQTINYIRGTTQLQMKWRNYSRGQTGKNISLAKFEIGLRIGNSIWWKFHSFKMRRSIKDLPDNYIKICWHPFRLINSQYNELIAINTLWSQLILALHLLVTAVNKHSRSFY